MGYWMAVWFFSGVSVGLSVAKWFTPSRRHRPEPGPRDIRERFKEWCEGMSEEDAKKIRQSIRSVMGEAPTDEQAAAQEATQ